MTKIDFTNFSFFSFNPKNNIAVVFEKIPPVRKYRDTLTFYKDGKVLFIRYCYGESAGEVARLWSKTTLSEKGEFNWDYEKDLYSKRDEAPMFLSAMDENGNIYCDDKPYVWEKKHCLKTDSKNGYSFFKCIFIK